MTFNEGMQIDPDAVRSGGGPGRGGQGEAAGEDGRRKQEAGVDEHAGSPGRLRSCNRPAYA